MIVKILGDSYEKHLREAKVDRSKVTNYEQALAAIHAAEAEWASTPLPELEGRTPAECLEGFDSPEQWRDFLTAWCARAGRSWLPEPVQMILVRRAVPDLVPMLCSLAEDDAQPYAGDKAVQVLGEAHSEEAVPALLALMEKADPTTHQADFVVEALRSIGEPARQGLYDLCERYREQVDSDQYSLPLEVLTRLPKNDRTWPYLRRALEQADDLIGLYGAIAGDYQDRRAVFFLNTILEERTDLPRHDQMIILESIELCGGVPTELAQMRIKPQPKVEAPEKVGRNDPCPCGSGKKFKKCCGK